MQKRTIILFTIISIISIFGLTGCAHTNINAPETKIINRTTYNKHSNSRSAIANLPADYPTRYLPDGDLWDDIRENLQLYNYGNVRQVKNQIYWFQTHKQFLNSTLVRGAQYMYFINQLIKKYHLPSDVILIPIFESGYVPVNRNHSSGAGGLWQFMPSTARGYGVRINNWYDGRFDPIQSSYAAMKHFSYLHYFFNNDWTLTFAAYDAGEGTIQNAMFRNQRRGLPLNYWSLGFPRQETYEYVPKLLALSAIIKDPARYGIVLPPINNGPYFEQINVGSSMSLEKAARLANTSVTVLHNLNPAYIRYRIPPTGPFVISIPASKVDIFKNNLAGKNTVVEPEVKEEATTPAKTEPTQPQETNTQQNSEQDLAKAAAEEKANVTENSTANNDNDTTTAGTTATETVANKVVTKNISYRIKKKDTIFSVAKHYHTTAAQIRKINHLRSNKISLGQTIRIPTKQTITVEQSVEQANDNNNVVATKKHRSQHYSKTKIHHKVAQSKVNNKIVKPQSDWETIPATTVGKSKNLSATKITKIKKPTSKRVHQKINSAKTKKVTSTKKAGKNNKKKKASP